MYKFEKINFMQRDLAKVANVQGLGHSKRNTYVTLMSTWQCLAANHPDTFPNVTKLSMVPGGHTCSTANCFF